MAECLPSVISAEAAVAAAFQSLKTDYRNPKAEQKEAAKSILEGKDVFAQLPTGFGKTTILALLPLAFDSLRRLPVKSCVVLCLSPLIALMHDQVKRLSEMGLDVCAIQSGQDNREILRNIENNQYQIIMTSPEMILNNNEVRRCIQDEKVKKRIVSVVIDEAHCIASW